uniref:RRM domain-containing protein n=1 Tax=Trichuris muris TaxID=70415 RepID=A0A5S6R088_TRIMR
MTFILGSVRESESRIHRRCISEVYSYSLAHSCPGLSCQQSTLNRRYRLIDKISPIRHPTGQKRVQGMPGERVFIGPLGDNVRQGDIRSFFKHVGNVKLVIRKRGFAFVDFANPREALRAIRRNDGQRLLGRRVRVEMAHELERRERQQRDQHHTSSSRVGLPLQGGNSNECVHSMHDLPRISNYRVKVDNLSLKVTWMELKSLFNLISEVAYAAVCHQYRLGFVEFRSFAGMEKAIAHLNGYILKGRRISVYPTNTKGRSQSIASESK